MNDFFNDGPASIVFEDGTSFEMKGIELDQYVEDGHDNNCRAKLLAATDSPVTFTNRGQTRVYATGPELMHIIELEERALLGGISFVLAKAVMHIKSN